MKINSLCILGGGTSGFIVSSIFAKYREASGLDFDIKLIHSDKIGSIGVGESTIFNINELLSYLELDDSDWMKECNATYKSSIRFENFYKIGRHFHYPFGVSDEFASGEQWMVIKEFFPDIVTPERATLYFNPLSILSVENKLTDEDNYLKNNTAYHFDSGLVGKYLKRYSEEKGVEIIEDKFYGTEQDKYGNIESIVCDNGTYRGDFFVDCSGFKSLLLGGVMGEDFIDFGDTLINNKALVAKIPYTDKEKQLKNYTNCVALKNGWCWEIPLWDGLSVGYVHTNMFASEEEIEEEFFEYVGDVDYKTINYRSGRYKNGWVKNVAAIGLSYGFVEPLESTSIATTLDNTFHLLDSLSKRDMFCTRIDKDSFNFAVGGKLDRYRNFIAMHYYLSSRDDSEYWQYVTENIDYGSEIYEETLRDLVIDRKLDYMVPDCNSNNSFRGDLFVAAGMNYSCFSKALSIHNGKDVPDTYDTEKLEKHMENLKLKSESYPSTYEYLKSTIYKTL